MTIELPPLRRYAQDFHRLIPRHYGSWCLVEQAEARERILTARIAELEADAERYQWLASRARKDNAHDRYGSGAHWRVDFFADDGRNAVDAAIDAAMVKGMKP